MDSGVAPSTRAVLRAREVGLWYPIDP